MSPRFRPTLHAICNGARDRGKHDPDNHAPQTKNAVNLPGDRAALAFACAKDFDEHQRPISKRANTGREDCAEEHEE